MSEPTAGTLTARIERGHVMAYPGDAPDGEETHPCTDQESCTTKRVNGQPIRHVWRVIWTSEWAHGTPPVAPSAETLTAQAYASTAENNARLRARVAELEAERERVADGYNRLVARVATSRRHVQHWEARAGAVEARVAENRMLVERAEVAAEIAQARDEILGEWVRRVEQAAEVERRAAVAEAAVARAGVVADELEADADRANNRPDRDLQTIGQAAGWDDAAWRIRQALGASAGTPATPQTAARAVPAAWPDPCRGAGGGAGTGDPGEGEPVRVLSPTRR
jgi:hypothetical protein